MTAAPPTFSTTLRQFAKDPARAGKLLRDAVSQDSTAFLQMVVGSDVYDVKDRGFRYALVLLRNNGLLIPAVADPSVTDLRQSLRLTRAAVALDAGFVNKLVDETLARAELRRTECILRVLDLVEECPDNVVNWRSISRLYQDGDSKVRAKCATLLVRFRFDERGVAVRFDEGEARVRANIVEALWEKDRSKAAGVLERALTDSNNRVQGNAFLALYNSGDTRALTGIAEMLDSRSPEFQITAAWVAGETRDIRFALRLLQAAGSADPNVQKAALKSLANLDPIDTMETSIWLRPVLASALCEQDRTELWIRVLTPEDDFAHSLRPTDFFVCAGDGILLDYSVNENKVSDPVSLRIVYPAGDRSVEQAIVDSLPAKPRSQRWALSSYGSGVGPDQQGTIPDFSQDPAVLRAEISRGTPGTTGAARSCRSLLRLDPYTTEQHLVVLADAAWLSGSETDGVRASCRERNVRLHCMATPDSDEAVGSSWKAFVAALHERYTLRARVAVPSGELLLREGSVTPARFSPSVPFVTWERA